MKIRPVLFIDLDGTLRRPINGEFINDASNQELIPGALEQLLFYKKHGYIAAVITNQGGVAHGYKTPASFQVELNHFLQILLDGKHAVDFVKACFHDSTGTVEPYCYHSICRKPGIGFLGMIEEVLFENKIAIDWENSLMVGDRDEDSGFAMNAGIRFMEAEVWRQPHPIEFSITSPSDGAQKQ